MKTMMKNPFWRTNNYWKRRELTGLGLTTVAVTALVLFFWGVNGIFGYWCEATADLYELEHHYTWVTGCNVLVDGQYQDIDNVRVHVQGER